jgi:NADPH:quinone reductase-like Zn-dependent oxidoreductase
MGGRLSVIGILTGFSGDVEIVPILAGSLHVDGIYVGSREMFESINRAIARSRLSPVIDACFRSPTRAPPTSTSVPARISARS